ncbi:MAG: hypothetical protein K2X73_03205 [Sphingomonas sp.]|nr:hypothetical protein [Sphingomonas sp.]
MRFDRALAMAGAVALAGAGIPCSAAVTVLRLSLCGGHAPIEIPLPGKSAPKPDCGAACHAACPRRTRLVPGNAA